MRHRNILFGYQYREGKIVINPKEALAVKRIFNDYLNGLSLLSISESLSKENIEYISGSCNWNKARLMRILEDVRYIGNDQYPAIIDYDIFSRIAIIKSQRCTTKTARSKFERIGADIKVNCHKCGEKMKRYHNIKCKCPEYWLCPNCKERISITDSELLENITSCLNRIIQNPNLINEGAVPQICRCAGIMQIENAISRELENVSVDREKVRTLICNLTSVKYSKIDNTHFISKKLKAEFEQSNPLSSFSKELFKRVAKGITLRPDCSVTIILQNNQSINKESH